MTGKMFVSSNQRQFQKGLDTDKMRSSRRDTQLSLRKKTREAHLQKRMRMLSAKESQPGPGGVSDPLEDVSVDRLPRYVADVMQTDSLKLQLSGTKSIRQLLSLQRKPPLQQVMACGVLPKIVNFILNTDDEAEPKRRDLLTEDQKLRQQLQYEAAWIVTNLSSGPPQATQYVVQLGVTEKLAKMVRYAPNEEHADMAVWALGNIAGESRKLVQRILNTGFLDDLITAMPNIRDHNHQGNAAWVLSNIMRNAPPLSGEQYERLIPAAAHILRTTTVSDALTNTLWTFTYLTSTEEHFDLLVQHGVVEVVVRLLGQESQKYERTLALKKAEQQKREEMYKRTGKAQPPDERRITLDAQKAMDHYVFRPCLRVIGNLVSGPDQLTQKVIDAGYLDVIDPFVNHFNGQFRKEVIWSLSNILAGSHQQIEAVLSKDDLLRSIMRAATSDNQSVKREATWCLGNATVDAISTQIKKLAEFGAIEALCKMLSPAYDLTDQHLQVIVEALEAFLKIYGKGGYNPFMDRVEECRGLDYLEDRQTDQRLSEETYTCIVEFMQKYWNDQDDFDGNADAVALSDQLKAVVDTTTNTFKFGCGGHADKMTILGNNDFHSNNNVNTAIYQF